MFSSRCTEFGGRHWRLNRSRGVEPIRRAAVFGVEFLDKTL